MSDTPITDAAASTSMFVDGEPVVEIKICRALERKLQKAQADAAAMREALNAIPFPCPCCSYATMHAGSCAIGSALSTNAGRELLEELQRLRGDYAELVNRNAECAKQLEKFNGEDLRLQNVIFELRDKLKSAREEVERTKADRNRAGVEERRKYLPKIQQLADDLAKAKAQCAAKDAALKIADDALLKHNNGCFPIDIYPAAIWKREAHSAVRDAQSPDCGKDYVHRSEVERLRSEVQRAYYEGHIHAISSDPELDPQEHSWPNSRARKIATGELK